MLLGTRKLMLSLEPYTLRDHQARTVYLVSYSQADVEKVGNRKAFADIVTGAFNQNKIFLTVWNTGTVLKRDTGKGTATTTWHLNSKVFTGENKLRKALLKDME